MKIGIFSIIAAISCALPLYGAPVPGVNVSVRNVAPFALPGHVVEIDGTHILPRTGRDFTVTATDGSQLPSQLTHDNKILVRTDLPAGSSTEFIISPAKAAGQSLLTDTICVAQIRPDKQDDFAWENDHGGYRLYGPVYRRGGGKVSGYDIWTKSVPYPTLKQRYDDHAAYGMSYHKDFGSGMDVYTVGRTLGAGMNALIDNDTICYPCAYESCEFLDNGPLRVTAKVTCYPETIGDDKNVVETRIITLDAGSWLNKTTVSYDGLTKPHPLTTGIVVHKQNKKAYAIDPQKRYFAYVDLTDNPANGNGAIFIGVVNPTLPDSITYVPLTPEVGDAIGQVMTHSTYNPGEEYTYYWGSGWSKGGVKGMDAWRRSLTEQYQLLNQYPLEITIE
ncbi:MAG: DUF4861 domain-containing protein [Duncaniella sp.]|nr:DUF4861 domain-containing protein [Duncaniella sp.]